MAKRPSSGQKRGSTRRSRPRHSQIPEQTPQIPDEFPPIPEETWRRLIFRTFGHQRFTQDSPIMPDVWLRYAKALPDSPVDLILTPKAGHAPGKIAVMLQDRLGHYHAGEPRQKHRAQTQIAYNS